MRKKYGAKEATDDYILRRMRFAGRISKTTRALADAHVHAPAHPHTHRHARTQKYVLLIALPRQHWFRECASMLLRTYIACLCSFRLSAKVELSWVNVAPPGQGCARTESGVMHLHKRIQ
jgi:hypothetical protein